MGHYNFQFRIRPDMWKRIAKLNITVDFYLYYISTPYFNDKTIRLMGIQKIEIGDICEIKQRKCISITCRIEMD